MNFNKKLLAVMLTGASVDVSAAAFQLIEHNASGLGRAYAGEAAVIDNASVIANNPALMSYFDKSQVSVAATFIKPDVAVEGAAINIPGVPASLLDSDDIAPSAVVPAAYFLMPTNDKVAIGFGVFSNFGLASEYPADYAAGLVAGETSITTVNFNANVSYKVDDMWSVAAGLNYVYASANVERYIGLNSFGLPMATTAVHLEGDDTASYGWNAGVAVEPLTGHRFGFHYRSEVDLTFTGDFTNDLPAAMGGLQGAKLDGEASVTLPAIAEFSGSHQVNDKASIHYSVLWTGWESFETLSAEAMGTTVFSKEENFSNSVRYSIGGDYQLNAMVTLRAGVAYDESPVDPNHRSISIPDSERRWYSFGTNVKLDEASSFDLGVSFVKGSTKSFDEANPVGGVVWSFESTGDATLFAAQYQYSF